MVLPLPIVLSFCNCIPLHGHFALPLTINSSSTRALIGKGMVEEPSPKVQLKHGIPCPFTYVTVLLLQPSNLSLKHIFTKKPTTNPLSFLSECFYVVCAWFMCVKVRACKPKLCKALWGAGKRSINPPTYLLTYTLAKLYYIGKSDPDSLI